MNFPIAGAWQDPRPKGRGESQSSERWLWGPGPPATGVPCKERGREARM